MRLRRRTPCRMHLLRGFGASCWDRTSRIHTCWGGRGRGRGGVVGRWKNEQVRRWMTTDDGRRTRRNRIENQLRKSKIKSSKAGEQIESEHQRPQHNTLHAASTWRLCISVERCGPRLAVGFGLHRAKMPVHSFVAQAQDAVGRFDGLHPTTPPWLIHPDLLLLLLLLLLSPASSAATTRAFSRRQQPHPLGFRQSPTTMASDHTK